MAGQRLLDRLRRRAIPMSIAAMLPFAAAAVYLKVQPARYETTASIFVDPQMGRPGRADATADPAVMAAHLRMATSRPVLQKALERERLVEDSTLFVRPTGLAALADALLSLIRGKPTQLQDRPAAILRLLTENVTARQSGEANLIEVTAVAEDAGSAARLANAVAQTFADELVATTDKAQGSDRSRLLAKADELKAKLREAEMRFAQARGTNGADPLGRAGEQDPAGQVARARTATLDAKAKSDQIQKLLATGKDMEAIADLVRSPSIERLRIQFNEAAAQEANFRTSLGPRHPAFLEAAEQAREKRRLLLEGLRLAASAARSDWQTAREFEMQLEKKLGDTGGAMPSSHSPPLQLRELEREVELAKLAYDRQMRMVEAADSAMQSMIARVVAKASVPAAAMPVSVPGLWKLAGLAGLSLALLAFMTGPSKSRQQRNKPSKMIRTVPNPAAEPVSEQPLVRSRPGPVMQDERTVPLTKEPEETIAHEFADKGEEFALQVTLVTAESPDTDKTGLAVRLARAAAKLDVRVLMIDADEQAQTLTSRFAAGTVAGKMMLQGRERMVVEAELAPGLRVWVVPQESARAVPANDTALRNYDRIAGHFDLVILDGPALASGLAVRRLARTAQSVVVAAMTSTVDKGRLATQLDVSTEILRVVPCEAHIQRPQQERSVRPMTVIRYQKCA